MANRILVVDDERDVLEVILASLEARGYEVTGASGGSAALEKLADTSFDLVLLDVMMPGMDGIEVCRRIKADERTAATPVVFLTAKGGGDALAKGLEAGAMMYIQKPFTTNKLLALIRAALGDTL